MGRKVVLGRCRIPYLLAKLNWSQQDLADRTGIDKRVISRYCNNKRKNMTLATSLTIASVLGCEPVDLFEISYENTSE